MIYNKLFDWQKLIIDKFQSKKELGVWLDCGLGKTPISLAFAERHKSNKILIVSIDKKASETIDEKGSFLWWANQMELSYNMYNKKYNFHNEGPKKYQATLTPESNDILIVNYESLYIHGLTELNEYGKKKKKCELKDNIVDFINNCRNQSVTIIIDESHKIKELDSLQTLAIKKIVRNLSFITTNLHLYLLTGTPFTQGFIDLYSQLKLLGWEGNKELFVNAFCIKGDIPGLMGWQQPIVAYKNVDKLYELVHQFAITIKSTDVIKLPDQVFQYHISPMSKEMLLYTAETLKRDLIQAEFDERDIKEELEVAPRNGRINNPFYRNIAYPDEKWMAETIGSFWMRARQLSIGFQGNAEYALWFNKNRLQQLRKLLEDNPDNYVLFYNYTPELLEIYDICEELGYNIDVYCGEMKSLIFYDKYSKQTEGEKLVNKKNIIITNFASGSTGANWQEYNKCILFSIPIFKDYEQALKRVHRIGQKETVIYHIFYEDNWLDKSMFESLNESKEYNKELFEADLKRIQTILQNN